MLAAASIHPRKIKSLERNSIPTIPNVWHTLAHTNQSNDVNNNKWILLSGVKAKTKVQIHDSERNIKKKMDDFSRLTVVDSTWFGKNVPDPRHQIESITDELPQFKLPLQWS